MARTKQTLDLLIELRMVRGARKMAALDLGCGDGAALKVLTMAGYKPVLGIEFDLTLAEIAQHNNKVAQVVCGDFTHFEYLHAFDFKGTIDVVYAFNPTSGELLSQALKILASRNAFTLVLRNPDALEEDQSQREVKVPVTKRWTNLAICKVESIV